MIMYLLFYPVGTLVLLTVCLWFGWWGSLSIPLTERRPTLIRAMFGALVVHIIAFLPVMIAAPLKGYPPVWWLFE